MSAVAGRSAAAQPLAARLWIYQAERFPLFKHGLLICVFSGGEAVFGATVRGATPDGREIAVAIVVCLLLFAQLRIADEHKDRFDDARYRPERPVPRGLVRLKELRTFAWIAAAVQVAASLWLDPRLVVVLLVVWSWMALMSVEFFVPAWLKARPVLYMLSHMAVMPLIALYAVSCGAHSAILVTPAVGAFLAMAFLNGIVLEIARKCWAPADERRGVETYSRLWGPHTAAFAAAIAAASSALLALLVQNAAGAAVGLGLVVLLGAGVLLAAAVSYGMETGQRRVGSARNRVGRVRAADLSGRRVAARGDAGLHMTLRILSGAAAPDRLRAGAKGAVLAELADAFPVPPFCVIPADSFGPQGLKPEFAAALEAAIANLGPGPYAVRSSGVEEDGAGAAHAGQFETRLDVAALDVAGAALAVWRSGFSESLAAYRQARGLSGAPQPPAVVIQRMVAAQAAGVAFSADPVSGEPVTVIGAVRGLGDKLVAGEVDGDTYRVSGDGQRLDGPQHGALSEDEVSAVAQLARRAERWFGAPQDIEWAIEDGRLYLLQSRPITALPVQDWSEVVVWDNSNIVESYPGVVSPFTFTFARRIYGHVYRAFVSLLGVSDTTIAENHATFDGLLGRVGGRIYYSLIAWHRALAMLPGFQSNRAWMEQMMGVGEPLPAGLVEHIAPSATTAKARMLDRVRLALAMVRLAGFNLALPGIRRRFQARLDAALAEPDHAIEALTAPQLAARFRRLESQLLARWDAPLINDFMCMVAFGLSRKVLEGWAGPAGLDAHAELMIGQGDIISAEPARRIRAMGAIARRNDDLIAQLEAADVDAARADLFLGRDLDAYLARFGDRCTGELKLESLTLHEDARPLLAAIAAAARAAPEAATQRQASDPLRSLFKGRPVKGFLARHLVQWAKARVRDRENLRFERTRLFGRVRRLVRASGLRLAETRLIDQADDIFLLTVDEWLGVIEGGATDRDLKGLIALRRTEQARDLAQPEPPERLVVHGAFLAGLPAALARSQPKDSAQSDTARTGQPCCAGVVEGRVRVIADPRVEALQPGEILVARSTDPGWIAIFANAAGVIAERGSLLSHSAIVAREMGVPCVVALKDATRWLKTGDLIRLDGASGRVERLEVAL